MKLNLNYKKIKPTDVTTPVTIAPVKLTVPRKVAGP